MLTTHLSIQVLVFVLFFNITEIQARRGGGFRANFGGGGGFSFFGKSNTRFRPFTRFGSGGGGGGSSHDEGLTQDQITARVNEENLKREEQAGKEWEAFQIYLNRFLNKETDKSKKDDGGKKQRKVLSKTEFGQSHGYFGTGGQSIFGKSHNLYDYNKSPFGGISGSKGLSVGAGAGFIGGGVAGVAAVSVYHQYLQYKSMISCKSQTVCYKREIGENQTQGIFFKAKECVGGCPNQAYCDHALCRCREGFEARYGSCLSSVEDFQAHQTEWNTRLNSSYNPYHQCYAHNDCQDVDMNMVCKFNKCTCKKNMKWNDEVHECQIYVDVDCSDVDVRTISNETDDVAILLPAGLSENEHNGTVNSNNGEKGNMTEDSTIRKYKIMTSLTADVTLINSQLTRIKPYNTSETEIRTTFCQEIAKIARIYAPPPEDIKSPASNSTDKGSLEPESEQKKN